MSDTKLKSTIAWTFTFPGVTRLSTLVFVYRDNAITRATVIYYGRVKESPPKTGSDVRRIWRKLYRIGFRAIKVKISADAQ